MLLNCKANMILQSGLGFQFGLISWPVVIVIHARNAHVIDTSLYLVTYPVKSWFLLELMNKIYWVETKLKKKSFILDRLLSLSFYSSPPYTFPPASPPPPVSLRLFYRWLSTSNQRFVLKINITDRPHRRQLGMHV